MEIVLSVLLSIIIIIIIVIAPCVAMYVFIKDLRTAKKDLKAKGFIRQLAIMHTYGLPVAEGVPCTMQEYRNRIEFYSGTANITLSKGKITDMCVKTETEIQQQYISSVGGAVGGALLFGPLGAMIGGRAKKKTSKTVTYYLIITYKSADASLANLCFDVSDCYSQAYRMAADFNETNTNGSTHIEL